jgi:1,4-alpha-glucan branching enzyme
MNDQALAADSQLNTDRAAARALSDGRLGDPFALLGRHSIDRGTAVRAYLPGAESVEVLHAGREPLRLQPLQITGLFAGLLPDEAAGAHYVLRIHWPGGVLEEREDPYDFGLLLGELDLYLLAEGNHLELGRVLGAHAMQIDGVNGVCFAVWAPGAMRVSVVGDFNGWDGRRHPMRRRVEGGVWELFMPRLAVGSRYKYEILSAAGLQPLKADPAAWQCEAPPATASIVADPTPFHWSDEAWLAARTASQCYLHAPLSIYEVHAPSWRRTPEGRSLTWDQLAESLIPYARELGFSHIELLPIMAHPFGGSWGYQPLSLYAPMPELGEPVAFARFVDCCHRAGLGVILDWVPGHFPTDAHGLARFDGSALYEHADPREGFHQDWNTLIYNFGRREVHAFLLSSALFWLEHFHVDGLRVDAVASMLYRDYSRREGEWIPNKYGGRENLEASAFLRHLNDVIAARCPGVMRIAEESTAWPGVTQPTRDWGLGFTYKWNMGWMHDTLHYLSLDPIYRAYQHEAITFGLAYAFSEHFILPLSHDEVVHGKSPLVGKVPGDRWQRFATVRAYLAFMWAHPGKKLLFMGAELGQEGEWNHDAQLDWTGLVDPMHAGMQRLVEDLNGCYRREAALHALDTEAAGFRWIVSEDRTNSIFAFYRAGAASAARVIAVCNFTPVPRYRYRLGAPRAGGWQEILNTDAQGYGGSNVGNQGRVQTSQQRSHGQPFSLEITVPPLATLYLRHDGIETAS